MNEFYKKDGMLSLAVGEERLAETPSLMLEAAAVCSETGCTPSHELQSAIDANAQALFTCTEPLSGLFERFICGHHFAQARLPFSSVLFAVMPELKQGNHSSPFSPLSRAVRQISGCSGGYAVKLALLLRSVCITDTVSAKSAVDRICLDDEVEADVMFLLENRNAAAMYDMEKRSEFTSLYGQRKAKLFAVFARALTALPPHGAMRRL